MEASRSTRRRALVIATRVLIIGVVLAALVALLVRQSILGAVSRPMRSETVFTRDMGVWDYSASRDDAEGLWIVVNYDHSSESDLKAYAAANKALIPEVQRRGDWAEVAISFRDPITPDQFRAWAKQNGLHARQTQLAAGNTTMMLVGTDSDPLPQQSIDKFPYAGLRGVFGSYGTVASKQLSAIASDPLVFLLERVMNIEQAGERVERSEQPSR